jgi:hypothetical protein
MKNYISPLPFPYANSKSQDCVLMNLYKDVFPKWTYDPHVAAPLPLYDHGNAMEEDVANQLML